MHRLRASNPQSTLVLVKPGSVQSYKNMSVKNKLYYIRSEGPSLEYPIQYYIIFVPAIQELTKYHTATESCFGL
jgi:hypothetical protein